MSASRERKARATKVVAQPVKQEKKKVSEGLILAISVILVLVAVFGTVLCIRNHQINQTVMTVGDKEIKVREFNYFFNQTANNLGNYASYLGIDTTTPIDQQKVNAESISMMGRLGMETDCLDAYKQEDGSYDITWAGYFAENAKESAAQTYALYQAALAAGYEASEEVTTSINNELLNVDLYAQIYSMSSDAFLEAQYGNGCNRENYEAYLTASYVATDYASNFMYSDAEIDAKYESAKDDFNVVTYMLYSANAENFEETEEGEEAAESTDTTTSTEETKVSVEAVAAAKAAAEAMAADFNEEDEDVTVYADHIKSSVETYVTEEAATWIFETAKAGDVKYFEDTENNIFYAVKVISNDVNYQTFNSLMIYIADDAEDAETTEDHEGHDHEEGEEVEETETLTAEQKLEAVKTALAEDASEENFRTLAGKYSSQSTADLEETSYGYINGNIGAEALAWYMGERKVGDYEVFEIEGATVVLYYNGLAESYRKLSVNAKMVTDWAETLTAETVAACNFDMEAAMNGAVGLTFNANTAS